MTDNIQTLPAVRRVSFVTDTGTRASVGWALAERITRAAALVVIDHTFDGRCDDASTAALAQLSHQIGEQLTPRLVELLEVPVTRYGKGAIAGTGGSLAQSAALLHPKLGKPMRALIGGGAAVIPSTQKIAGPGAWLDVPIAHKDDPWSFDAIDTFTLGLSDAPAPNQHVLIIVLAGEAAPAAT